MTTAAPRCLVADDHPGLLLAVSSYLARNGFEVVGEAADGESAVGIAEREQPELALVDYRMPRGAGVELVRRLCAVAPALRVAVYTAEADDSLVEEALSAGAAAVVLKEAPLADLVRALETVRSGRPYVDAAIAARSLRSRPDAATSTLTRRETEVLRLLAEGLTHDEVGERLGIGSETARTHLRKACGRLGVATRTAAVARAIRMGVIE